MASSRVCLNELRGIYLIKSPLTPLCQRGVMNDYSKVVMLMGRYVLMSCLLMLGCACYLTKTPHNVVALLAFMALLY